MSDNPAVSMFTILVLYGKLRRARANRDSACEKLRGLIDLLSPVDRKTLSKGIDDWENNQGKKIATGSAPLVQEEEPASPAPPDSRYIFGMSEYDRMSAERGSSALRPLHGVMLCPTCGEKTDMNAEICAHCGNLLDEFVAQANKADTKGQTWFGPTSRLLFAINGASDPLDIPIGNGLSLGRHTPDSTQANVDLTEYRADVLGVSRVHARIKRQGMGLALIDLHSTNHTYVNGRQLADDEICTLTSGDEVYLAELGFTVIFRNEPQPPEPQP